MSNLTSLEGNSITVYVEAISPIFAIEVLVANS